MKKFKVKVTLEFDYSYSYTPDGWFYDEKEYEASIKDAIDDEWFSYYNSAKKSTEVVDIEVVDEN